MFRQKMLDVHVLLLIMLVALVNLENVIKINNIQG